MIVRRCLIEALKRFSVWRFGVPRVIMSRDGLGPYLTRYYILGGPMTEGMEVQDASRKRFGLYLHGFRRSDDADDLHNHPWAWAASLILTGGYSEERLTDRNDELVRREYTPGSINILNERTFHRIDLNPFAGPTWTLFLTGPRVQGWGFLTRTARRFIGWRQYCGLDAS